MTTQPLAPTADLTGFVRTHQRGLWRYLRVLGCPSDRAEDLAQEAFVTCWRKAAASGDRRRDGAFLRKVARDAWISDQRRESARRRIEGMATQLDEVWPADQAGEEWLEALRACRAELTGRPAEAVAAFYDAGQDRATCVADLGMTPNGLKTLLQRTRAVLRECVERRLRVGRAATEETR